jgi:hypothetical protein
MVTQKDLTKKVQKYKDEIKEIKGAGGDADKEKLRLLRKRLKRNQRKLAEVAHEEKRLSGKGKKAGEAKS